MKRTKSSTKSAAGIFVPRQQVTYQSCYTSPEILDHLKQCEAREWIKRYKKKIGEVGSVSARSWWEGVKEDIARRRGKPALEDLVKRMNKEKSNA